MKIQARKYPADVSKITNNRYYGVLLYKEWTGYVYRWTLDVYLGKWVRVWFWEAK